MRHKYKVITIFLLVAIAIALTAALFMLPNKALFSILSGIYALGLFVYYLFSRNNQTSHEDDSKKYSNILIVEELALFFSKKKPYLNPDFKISDLEKQLKVSRSAITAFTKKRYRRNFNQFLNLWRIAELQRLQSLPENEDVSINKLCIKAGFSNAQQYCLAEKERKAINRNKSKNKPVIKKPEDDILNDLDIKRKPKIQMRI